MRDLEALKVIVNAKTQRPSTCNTVETLLVNKNIADSFLPVLSKQMAESGVTLHADAAALTRLLTGPAKVVAVKPKSMTMRVSVIEFERQNRQRS